MKNPKHSFWSTAASEPYRIFFPLGVLVGISGVSLWPLYFSGIHHSFYPGVMHARMMIEGFVGAFVIGFMGTVIPRLSGGSPISKPQLAALLTLFAVAVGMHIAEHYLLGDIAFLLLLLVLGLILSRCIGRGRVLPPGAVLIGLGYLQAIAGAGLFVLSASGSGPPQLAFLANLLLYQGFVLCAALGTVSIVSNGIREKWREQVAVACLFALFLLCSFAMEALAMMPRTGIAIRAIAVAGFFFSQFPHRTNAPAFGLSRWMNLALILSILGLSLLLLWPEQRFAGLHAVFIGGFNIIVLTAATRLIGERGGSVDPAQALPPFVSSAMILLLLSGVLRVVGDFFPSGRGSVLSYASYIWMLASLVWVVKILPWVRRIELR